MILHTLDLEGQASRAARRPFWGADAPRYVVLIIACGALQIALNAAAAASTVDADVLRIAHSLAEVFFIMACATIFALAWNARIPHSGRIEVAGLMFLAIGLVDFMHLMSFQPFSFLNQSDSQNNIVDFGLAVRLLMLLTLAWVAWNPQFPGLSRPTLFAALTAVVLLFAVLFYLTVVRQALLQLVLARFPLADLARTTSQRTVVELLLVASGLVVAWRYLRRFDGLTEPIHWQLATATLLLTLAALQFSIPDTQPLSLPSLGANICKLLAGYFIYRAFVEGSIEYPREQIRQLNAELTANERRWREAIDAGSHGVVEWLLVPDSIHLAGSHLSQLGLDVDALRRLGSRSLLEQVHPAERPVLDDQLQAMRQGRLDMLQTCVQLAEPDHTDRWLELRLARTRHEGAIGGMIVGSVTDVSEHQRALARLEQSEAKLNGIIESAMDGIITLDDTLHIVLFNQAAEAIFRCKSEQALGQKLDRFLPMRHRDSHDQHIRRFGTTGISQRRMGFSILPALRADGSEFPISASISQIRVDTHTLYTVIVRDVSTQVTSERALMQSQRELTELSLRAHRALEDERRRVARELHDDFGQSLTAMRMELGLARTCVDSGDQALLEHCSRMESMISSMVASSRRISSDLRPLVLDDLGLGAAIEWLVERFTEQHRIAADVYVDEEVAHLPEPHASALFRIVQESLTNVAKHSGATSVEVHIESQEDKIMASIWDNGRGLAPDSLEQRKTFGLRGLRERAQLLGGSFDIFSRMGEGTTIRVLLPRPTADATEEQR